MKAIKMETNRGRSRGMPHATHWGTGELKLGTGMAPHVRVVSRAMQQVT